jgi:hypothetical protein
MEEYTKAGLKNIDAIELDSLAFHQNIIYKESGEIKNEMIIF